MRLPVIKHLTSHIEDKGRRSLEDAIEVLEGLAEAPSLKGEEVDVIGELLSNMYGALEVERAIASGTPKNDALNAFMKRVLGAIDK